MKKRTCKIEGCEKPYFANGLCNMHYSRVRNGLKDMRSGKLSKLWKPNDPRWKNVISFCTIEGCNEKHYAKGLCKNHYELNRRTGKTVYYKDIPKPQCSVEGCESLATSLTSGLCAFHKTRKMNGIPLNRPKGIKGPLNRHWNGGVFEYPNHYEMKKMRRIILKEAKYACHYCGKPANQIHHKDLSKDNHSKDNLVACCCKCNRQRSKIYTSKYRRLYGKTLKELADDSGVTANAIYYRHKKGLLIPEAVQAVLY